MSGGKPETVDFFLHLDEEIDEGEYNLKVKVRKDNQKTLKELTGKIYIKNKDKNKEEKNISVSLESTIKNNDHSKFYPISSKEGDGILVYQGTSKKAWNLTPIILVITFGLLMVVLVFKRF